MTTNMFYCVYDENNENKRKQINSITEAPHNSIVFENIDNFNEFYNFPHINYCIMELHISEKTIYFYVKENEYFFVKKLDICSSIYSVNNYHGIIINAWVFNSIPQILDYYNNPEKYEFVDFLNIYGYILHMCINKPEKHCHIYSIKSLKNLLKLSN